MSSGLPVPEFTRNGHGGRDTLGVNVGRSIQKSAALANRQAASVASITDLEQ
jgi:hypothetical protein